MALHRAHPGIAPPDRGLVDALRSPAAYPHPVRSVHVEETHISWVLLAGDYAYKIKKPLTLPFLDFGTLEKRRFYCHEELRLNQPWAPEIYLDVQPIVAGDGQPLIGGAGEPIEYALRMRRFDQALCLDRQLENGLLHRADMQELGTVIADRHAAAARLPATRRDELVATTRRFIEDNFDALENNVDPGLLTPLADWSRLEFERLDALLGRRVEEGFVRECHGDLHLGNLVRLPQGIRTFDCIEFDPALREIDVICDVAFLVMDLLARRRPGLAALFLNRYLECSGDYEDVAVLDLFIVYRALVRAKVAAIAAREHAAGPQRKKEARRVRAYCELALAQVRKGPPVLVLMHGLSAAGKTRLSTELLAALPAIRIRSDIERKRLHGLGEAEQSGSEIGGGIYASAATDAVYARLAAQAERALAHRHSVILDAAFLGQRQRQAALDVAARAGVAAVIVHVDAPEATLRDRLAARATGGRGASEADAAVLDFQLASREALSALEEQRTIRIDTTRDIDVAGLADRIRSPGRTGARG